MPNIWTDPRTWIDGETPTGAMFNTQLRDNLNFLKNTPAFSGDISVVGDVTVGDDLITSGSATINEDLNVKGNTQLGDSMATDTVNITAVVTGPRLKTYTEQSSSPATAGGAVTLDCNLGTYFTVSVGGNNALTVTITNPPVAQAVLGISVVLLTGSVPVTVTWPASVKWAGGTTPPITATAGRRDLFTLITYDGGLSWLGIVVGQDYP